MTIKRLSLILVATLMGGLMLFATLSQAASAGEEVPADNNGGRTGAWVDTIHISTIPTGINAIDALEAGSIHFYTQNMADPVLYPRVEYNPDLVYARASGNYNDLTINPAGPVFGGTGKLNPFDVPEIREALNWLIDRDHIVQEILGGWSAPRFTTLSTQQTDYARYHETIGNLETYYAYDPVQASAVISAEMLNLGAYLVGDTWYYDGEPVTLIFIIRTEDERTEIGDYIADQLESIGFTVDRLYKNSPEASEYWIHDDPEEGTWHLYTGGWVSSQVNRDEGANFGDYYTPLGWDIALWQAYTPTTEFMNLAEKLYYRDYVDMDERDQLFTDALPLSLEDFLRVYLVEARGFSPRRVEVTAAYNLVGGLYGSDLWPVTARFIGLEGGVLEIAQPYLFYEPWNPVGGVRAIYDAFAQRATEDEGVVIDPNNGLAWAQRVESADLYVQPGAVVTQTLDWVNLYYSDTIEVPADAWARWDAVNQAWITAAVAYPSTEYANLKSVVRYPVDLYTAVNWHDGSPFSVADFIMAMILPFDIGDPASAIYDDSRADELDGFLSAFKGYRITSADPLEIEFYSDAYPQLDAELTVETMWPDYGRGEAPWHTVALGVLAEANNDLAFTASKADGEGVEWMDFLTYPSLTTLSLHLDQAILDTHIPYSNTLSAYITPAEATARWSNLDTWYGTYGHFWVGTGPFYLEAYSHGAGTMTLQRNPVFPDPAGKWDRFSHDPSPAAVEINYDTGAPGSAFNISGTNYPINSFGDIDVNGEDLGTIFTGETGTFTFTLTTDVLAEEGTYHVTVSVNPSDFTTYVLDTAEPTRPVEGTHEAIPVPDDIPAYTDFIYLPVLFR